MNEWTTSIQPPGLMKMRFDASFERLRHHGQQQLATTFSSLRHEYS